MSSNEEFRIATLLHVGEGCHPNSKARTDVYVLNPGQRFDRFGGSSTGLVVEKTASLIVSRTDEAGGRYDAEYAVNDAKAMNFWSYLTERVDKGDRLVGPSR